MDIPVQTAIDCDQAFNRLQEAEDCDEICEEADPRGSWAWLVDRVAHGTWVSAYIDPRYQRQLEELADEWLLRLAVRPFARAGESAIELQTPGVRTDLLRRCEEGLSDYRLSEVYHGFDPLSQQGYVELAKEGIFDWRIRASSPSFELRRCLECNSWFIPQRAGRARFCKDRCRSRFNSSRGPEMPSDFDCTAWAIPSYSLLGWQRPCYLMNDGYVKTYRELVEETDWELYGRGKDPRCDNCMAHCGYEPTAVLATMDSLKESLRSLVG